MIVKEDRRVEKIVAPEYSISFFTFPPPPPPPLAARLNTAVSFSPWDMRLWDKLPLLTFVADTPQPSKLL